MVAETTFTATLAPEASAPPLVASAVAVEETVFFAVRLTAPPEVIAASPATRTRASLVVVTMAAAASALALKAFGIPASALDVAVAVARRSTLAALMRAPVSRSTEASTSVTAAVRGVVVMRISPLALAEAVSAPEAVTTAFSMEIVAWATESISLVAVKVMRPPSMVAAALPAPASPIAMLAPALVRVPVAVSVTSPARPPLTDEASNRPPASTDRWGAMRVMSPEPLWARVSMRPSEAMVMELSASSRTEPPLVTRLGERLAPVALAAPPVMTRSRGSSCRVPALPWAAPRSIKAAPSRSVCFALNSTKPPSPEVPPAAANRAPLATARSVPALTTMEPASDWAPTPDTLTSAVDAISMVRPDVMSTRPPFTPAAPCALMAPAMLTLSPDRATFPEAP